MSGRALTRVGESFWPMVQGALAAAIAWWIALRLAGHPQPFFAPIAAVIALNANPGRRGTNAIHLLFGVLLGIIVGEVALSFFGTGFAVMGIATLVGMAAATAFDGSRLVIAQGAVGAILTVAGGQPEFGPERIIDALIGAGVALVFSQILFPARPIALLRRAEADVLGGMATSLELTAESLRHEVDDRAEQAIGGLRSLRDKLTELADTRENSSRTVRHAPVWWWRSAPIVRESENAGQLDLLNNSLLMLIRSVFALPEEDRDDFAPVTGRIAEVLRALAVDPGDQGARQKAAEGALESYRMLEADESDPQKSAQARAVVRTTAIDIMVFAGVEPDQARGLIEKHDAEVDVPDPPRLSLLPARLKRLWRRRRK
ncbi:MULTISPECIES: FUSC family protein [Brevibacterium]|nr:MULTISPECIES: FUSC family protein [Brevibacterium]